MADNPHNGHRNRLRKKFLDNSFDGLETHEILELMLYYAIPRKDTNPIAHKLIDSFGSLSAVFDAPIDKLKEQGISENCAIYLKLIPQICRMYMEDKHNNKEKVIDIDNTGEKLKHKFVGRDYEAVVLLLLDSKYKEVFCGVVSKGSVSACEVYVRKVIELAVLYNAKFAVLAHNHPSGLALPSNADIVTTKRVHQALRLIDVVLLDHVIVADDDYVSLKESGFMEELCL
ncbi:MAG: JAB domain-containing protein [Acutalibacteraceae bacterium]|nr:JAB domain-containing protein [Acutalibacteraceae bacterium]